MEPNTILSQKKIDELCHVLKSRFEKNMNRHKNLKWVTIHKKLEVNKEILFVLSEMERTGGEPDVVGIDQKTGEYIFYDCSPESPAGRRSLCYDREAWEARKENKPKGSVMELCFSMGVTLLNEEEYRYLQTLGAFDVKTSSWVNTPTAIRSLGGAFFCDRRYDHVFVYHNGAESYYASRGFRGMVRV